MAQAVRSNSTPVPASGMGTFPSPSLSRRHFLGGGAAALLPSGAAAASLSSASASSGALTTALDAARELESPELLQIETDLSAARERFQRAVRKLGEAREAALRAAPTAPQGLAVPRGLSVFGYLSWETLPEPSNILGEPLALPPFLVPAKGIELPVKIPSTEDILRNVRSRFTLRPQDRAEFRRLYDLAVEYETATERAREIAGLNDAEIEHGHAGHALVKLCWDCRHIEPASIAGLWIKARVIDACMDVPSQQAADVARLTSSFLPASICAVLGGVQ